MNLRIVLTRSHNVFDIGGINTYVWSIACELSKRFEVHVISGCGESHKIDKYWKERFRGQTHVLRESNFTSPREEFLQWAMKGSRLIREIAPEILHFNGMIPFLLLPLLAKTPSIVTCHGLLNNPSNCLHMAYGRLSYRDFVHAIIAVSKKVKKELLRYLGVNDRKVSVIPPGFEMDAFRPLPLEKRETAIMSGWGFIKNPQASLRVFHTLRKQGLRCRLYIAGVNHEQALSSSPELAHLLRSKHIVFTGKLDRYSMIELCRKVKCGLVPSLYESFSYGVLELLACGTPVVASYAIPSGVLPIESHYFRTTHNDVQTMSNRVYDLLVNEELWKSVSRSGLQHARKFTLDRVVEGLLNIYRSITDKGPIKAGAL